MRYIDHLAGPQRSERPPLPKDPLLGTGLTVTPQTFGARGDGINDDTVSINRALAFLAFVGGGELYLPATQSLVGYLVSGPLVYTAGRLLIRGDGVQSTITKTGTTGDLFQFSAAAPAGVDITIRDVCVVASQSSTADCLFNFNSTGSQGRFKLDNVFTVGGWDVVIFAGGENVLVTNSEFAIFVNNGVHYGPSFGGIAKISDTDMVCVQANAGFGVLIENGDGFIFNDINISGVNLGVYVHPPASGNFVRNLFCTNVFCDGAVRTSSNFGWLMDGTVSGALIQRVQLENCWAGAMDSDGFGFAGVLGLTMVNCRAIANAGQGIHLLNNTPVNDHVELIGCTCEWNSSASSGTNSGLVIESGNNDVTVIGGRYGPSSVTNNTQAYGIVLNGVSHSNIMLIGVDLSGNVNSGWSNSATGGVVVSNCIGDTTVGTTNVTVLASGSVYTAGTHRETYYINGGTITSIVSGVTLYSGVTNVTINLDPGQALQINYSVGPTSIKKTVHF